MDVAAAIAGFIGLAGNIIQGCQYLNNLLDDVKEAPKAVVGIAAEINGLQATLQAFRVILVEIQNYSLAPSNISPPDPTVALENCQNAVQQLRALIDRYVDSATQTSSPAGSNHVPSLFSRQRLCQRLGLAWKKEKLDKHVANLERAKTSLLGVKLNLVLWLNIRSNARFEQLSVLIESTMRNSPNPAITWTDCGLLTGNNQDSSDPRESADTTISTDATPTASQPHGTHDEDSVHDSSRIDVTTITQRQKALTTGQPGQALGRSSTTNAISTLSLTPARSPRRQKKQTSTYNFWFAKFQISSIVTEQEDMTDEDYLALTLNSHRTEFAVHPSLWLFKKGVLFQGGSSRPALTGPTWDNRLRVFNIHPYDARSPIIEAIEDADYDTFRKLLQSRQVTPFDLIDDGNDHRRNLAEMLTKSTWLVDVPTAKLETWFKMAQLLVDNGVDCGCGSSLANLMLAFDQRSDHSSHTLLERWTRLLLARSETDPLNEEVALSLNEFCSGGTIIAQQDDWDTSDFGDLVQIKLGKGTWDFCLTRQGDFVEREGLWHEKWLAMSTSERHSKEHCGAELGEYFARMDWPIYCWKDKPPIFRRSRERCMEAFGSDFIRFTWPSLLWEERRPDFWRSREACRAAFGDDFVNYLWLKLIEKEVFEQLEGLGAWAYGNFYGFYCWDDEIRPGWVMLKTEEWHYDDTSQRHSKQHCQMTYGSHFVDEEWPTLLREEGLDEDKVLELTSQHVEDGRIHEVDDSDESGWETAEE